MGPYFRPVIAAAVLLAAAAVDPIAGTWEGTSVCQVRPSPCQDEHALYRITKIAPNRYRIDGFRVVGSRELFMGPVDATFDAGRQRLDGLAGVAHLRLALRSGHLSGTMTNADGTVYRIIELTKR